MIKSFQTLREDFSKNPYWSYEERKNKLLILRRLIVNHQNTLIQCIKNDFQGHRSEDETWMAEIFPTLEMLDDTLSCLKEWMCVEQRKVSWIHQPAKAQVMPQPLGVVGIISPWNYPLYLLLGPLITAMAAGNRVLLKPSEFTPSFSEKISNLVSSHFLESDVQVVLGDAKAAEEFSNLPFDHLIFTGSTETGRKVAQAAARNLTPVTLELGGKSPAILHESYSVKKAAEAIVFSKGINAGQTCVAPDTVYCHRSQVELLCQELIKHFNTMFPNYQSNPDYSNIISQRHTKRLQELEIQANNHCKKIIRAQTGASDTKIPLTLVIEPNEQAQLMGEEIFGPLLPIVPYDRLDELIASLRLKPRPLALYYFDRDQQRIEGVLKNTHSGGVTINDCAFHVVQTRLPFGGVGNSGMGYTHGIEGFHALSKMKSVFYRSTLNSAKLVHPPYQNSKLPLLKKFFFKPKHGKR